MIRDQHLLLLTIGGAVVALVAAALLLSSQGAGDRELARRIGRLRDGAVIAQRRSRLLPTSIALVRRLGNVMRDRMLSARDSEALAKSLAASGLEPSNAIPIFVAAKLACLFAIPGLTYLGAALGGTPAASRFCSLCSR